MSRKYFVAATLVSLISGCADAEWDGVTFVDERFSPSEQAAIQQAADMWSDATGGAIHFNLVFGEHLPANPRNAIVHADPSNLPAVLKDADAYGITDYYTRTIVIASGVCADPIVCFAHELGHSAGLIHIEDEPMAMMHPGLEPHKCITRSDIAMACKINHHDCTGLTLKPCD